MDIIICIVSSVLFLPIILLNLTGLTRIILGLPFILFIPGYLSTCALFPTKKTARGLDGIERIALSFALSVAIVPAIGLGLNYTPWGISAESMYLFVVCFIILVGSIAVIRWFRTLPAERFVLDVTLSKPTSMDKLNLTLIIVVIISILLTTASFIYIITTPKQEETFTEFYILDSDGMLMNQTITRATGENNTIIIGLVNNEYKQINYTIQLWLINQTENEQEHPTNMWFQDEIRTTLNHSSIDADGAWMPQWEYNYLFNINKTGTFKLLFLLFTTPTQEYEKDFDYKEREQEIMNSGYVQSLYVHITVS